MKKKEKGNNSTLMAIIAILAIVVIVFLIGMNRNGANRFRPDIAASIDTDGNVYDGSNNYVGKLADPDIKFYDEEGNLMGQATFNIVERKTGPGPVK